MRPSGQLNGRMGRASQAATAERVGVLAIALGVLAATCCVWAWMAYSYSFGAKVSVQITTDCLASLQDDTSQVLRCPDSSWKAGGGVHYGQLLDYGQNAGPVDLDAVPARVVGTTARTQPPPLVLAAGLAGPPALVLAGGIALLAMRSAGRRFRVRTVPLEAPVPA
jgi:hypothetical protein